MNEGFIEQWSDTLSEIRQARRAKITKEVASVGAAYPLKNFYEVLSESLEEVVAKWWGIEQDSWKVASHKEMEADLQRVQNELDALVDFEMEALDDDTTFVKEKVTWPHNDIVREQENLLSFSEEIRKNYRIKSESLRTSGDQKKKPGATPEPSSAKRPRATASSSSGGGIAVFGMFILGLIIGGGIGVNFWYKSKDVKAVYEKKIENLKLDQQATQEQLTMITDLFTKMARGKMKTLPELKAKMTPIKEAYDEERTQVINYYAKKRETLLKRGSSGARLDDILEKFKKDKQAELDSIQKREERELGSLQKDIDLLNDMLSGSKE